MAKILLTGGAGYIGSHTNLALAEAGHETVVFDNLSTGFKELVVAGELIVGDLLDKQAISDVLREGHFDAVIHLAAKSLVGESFKDPALYWRNNLIGSRNLIDSMREFGPKAIVFSSSAAVYGNATTSPIAETHAKSPINPYGKTKLAIEWMLEDQRDEICTVNLRYFNACGADPRGRIGLLIRNDPHLIPVCLDSISGLRGAVKVFGKDYNSHDGTCIRDYVHVSDLAEAHLLALEGLLSGSSNGSFNLGTNRGASVLEIIDCVEKICGASLKLEFSERRAGDPDELVSDATLAKTELNWEPHFSDLETIISTAWEWHRRNL